LTIPSGLSVGSFDIAVTVTDNNGLTSVLTITVTVS
jgi:hypothetical protein